MWSSDHESLYRHIHVTYHHYITSLRDCVKEHASAHIQFVLLRSFLSKIQASGKLAQNLLIKPHVCRAVLLRNTMLNVPDYEGLMLVIYPVWADLMYVTSLTGTKVIFTWIV